MRRLFPLLKTVHFYRFIAGLFLLYWPLRYVYFLVFHPVETVTPASLLKRGNDFHYIRMIEPEYETMRTVRFNVWYVTPLHSASDTAIIYLNQDRRISSVMEMKDSSLHPALLPKVITAANLELTPVPGNRYRELDDFLRKRFPKGFIVFEEYEEPVWWGNLLLALAGIALMLVSLKGLRAVMHPEEN